MSQWWLARWLKTCYCISMQLSAWLLWQRTQDLLRPSRTFFKVGNLGGYRKSNGYCWKSSEVPRQSVSIKQLKSDRGSHFHVSCSSNCPHVIYIWVKRVWEPQSHSWFHCVLQDIVIGLLRVPQKHCLGWLSVRSHGLWLDSWIELRPTGFQFAMPALCWNL